MISRKLSLLVIAFVCTIFTGLIQTAHGSSIAYVDFPDPPALVEARRIKDDMEVTGRFTWAKIPGNKTRVAGQFNNGFKSSDVNDYTFSIECRDNSKRGNKSRKMFTDDLKKKLHITPPGTSPYQNDFDANKMSVVDFLKKCTFSVKFRGKKIGKAPIQETY